MSSRAVAYAVWPLVVTLAVGLQMIAITTVRAVSPPTTVASDGFNRSVTGGWGTADVGGAWDQSGAAYAVSPGAATITGQGSLGGELTSVSVRDAEYLVRFQVTATAVGSYAAGIRARWSAGSGYYLIKLNYNSSHAAGWEWRAYTNRSGTSTSLAHNTNAGFAPLMNVPSTVWMRVRVTGGSPTQVLARAWNDGSSEPGSWQLSFTDSTAGLQSAGSVGLYGSVQTSSVKFNSLGVIGVGPAAAPGAPTGVAATPASGQASVSWTAPTSDGGSAITGYTVTSSPGGLTASVSGAVTTATVTGLTNGTSYTFTVTATNAAGTGPASAPSNAVTPATVPGAPAGVTASAGNAQAVVSWTAPASNGGSAITGYLVTASPGGQTASVNGSTTAAAVTGLTNGAAYTFTVSATNGMGSGPASAASNSVTPAAVPGAPTGVAASGGNQQATVSWTAPVSDGGSAITGYLVSSSPGNQTASVSGGTTTAVVTGLFNGTAYTFTVTATNAVGTSPASAPSNPVTPATAPGPPTAVTASGGNGQATVTWTPPASNGGSPITGYLVVSSPGGQTATVDGGTTTTVVTGLSNGTAYTFTVAATTSAGTGSASAPSNSVTPADVPGAPIGVTASPGNSQALVSWTPPDSNGGSAITGYLVTASPGGQTAGVNGSTTMATVTGLTNGTAYTFTVTASNAMGSGPASAPSAAVTPTSAPAAPTAPTGVTASGGNQQATVSWTAPASDGGSAITGYLVTSSPGGQTASASAGTTTAVVTGLFNGTSYTFTVTATNAVGTSPASAPSNPVTPATTPGAPLAVIARGGDAQSTVTWTAPAFNGGSAITGYTVTASPGNQTASVSGGTTTAIVTGLSNGTTYTFTVTATNAAGSGPASAPSNTVTAAPLGSGCPAGGQTVTDAPSLSAALSAATPGAVIRMAPGTYAGHFVATVSGTPSAPITLCGSRDAVIDGGSTQSGYALHVNGASWWTLVGFSVQGGQKGVVTDHASHVLISGLYVHDIGDEAIHLRSFSSDNIVEGTVVRRTGLYNTFFGEGIYIGSANSNWCRYTACAPDQSDRNVIRNNDISLTTAENIDIKEGTTGGVVTGNRLSGQGMVATASTAWVNAKGNSWTISGNAGDTSVRDGFQVHQVYTGWGEQNVFQGNEAVVNGPGYGFYVQYNNLGTVLGCDNTAFGAAKGLSNIACS